jgi:hypothetical protein
MWKKGPCQLLQPEWETLQISQHSDKILILFQLHINDSNIREMPQLTYLEAVRPGIWEGMERG